VLRGPGHLFSPGPFDHPWAFGGLLRSRLVKYSFDPQMRSCQVLEIRRFAIVDSSV
jgi:hypothetical protein